MAATDAVRELEVWDGLSTAERETVAREVASRLPGFFTWAGMRRHEMGGQSHEVAFFTLNDEPGAPEFALVPGASAARLGYDRENPFAPTAAQQEEWDATAEQYGTAEIGVYLDWWSTPRRQVRLEPLLIEVRAANREELLGDLREATGSDDPLNDTDLIRAVCGERFRLLTTDEWEYACSGGPVTTLFRWGNETPVGQTSYGIEGWDLHKRPNAFGLAMIADTYQFEVCAGSEPGTTEIRGGDGGSAVCGGAEGFTTWLPLASSHIQVEDEVLERQEALWRRAFPVPV